MRKKCIAKMTNYVNVIESTLAKGLCERIGGKVKGERHNVMLLKSKRR